EDHDRADEELGSIADEEVVPEGAERPRVTHHACPIAGADGAVRAPSTRRPPHRTAAIDVTAKITKRITSVRSPAAHSTPIPSPAQNVPNVVSISPNTNFRP